MWNGLEKSISLPYGVLQISCTIPMEPVMHMPEKFTVAQREQIVIKPFTAANIAELCRRHGVSVALFHRWKEGSWRIIKGK